MTFTTMNTSDFGKLVGKVGKSGNEYNKLVQAALEQAVFQLSAYGNTVYADRLFTAVRSTDKKRVSSYLAEHGKVYQITDKQRKQAQDKGKPIDQTRVFAKIAKTAPDTSTPEAKANAENQAADLVESLPDWVEWSKVKTSANAEEKVIKFGHNFGRLLESLANGKVQDGEQQQVEAFKSFATFVQSGVTYEELRQQIIAEYEEKVATVTTPEKAVKTA